MLAQTTEQVDRFKKLDNYSVPKVDPVFGKPMASGPQHSLGWVAPWKVQLVRLWQTTTVWFVNMNMVLRTTTRPFVNMKLTRSS